MPLLSLAAGGVHSGARRQSQKAGRGSQVTDGTSREVDKADPKLKAAVEKAPVSAVFTTFGISFLIGGAGGKGVVVNNVTKQVTYMDMAQASAGEQIGAAGSETPIIFKTPAAMQN